MKKDQYQDQYDEIFKSLKEEKMYWNFEDFLKENRTTKHRKPRIISQLPKSQLPKRNLFRFKMMWLAASIIFIGGIFFTIQICNKERSPIRKQNDLVKLELEKQKNKIFKSSSIATIKDTLQNVKPFTEDTISHEISNPDEIINKIVPKRGRIKKINNEKYTQNKPTKKEMTEYQDNYVMINGHKIKNEEEAINITKYSFQILSENVTETLASSIVEEMPNNE